MRKNIVAGNWKMNNNAQETKELLKELKASVKELPLKNTRVLVAPSYTNLTSALKKTKKSRIEVAAQNMHQQTSGAYTGEISADMLYSIGIRSVIIGHSERRAYFGEDDAILLSKVKAALKNNLEVIFCFGELLEDRKSDQHFAVVEAQLKNVVFQLDADEWDNVVLAYEPVWAIGTGETASPEQAQEMHAFVRELVEKHYNKNVAAEVSILYGGSVKPGNATEIFSKEDVDGGLIGGAALHAADFIAIIKAI